ncbi:MAG: hypothetical protein GY943_02245 [Chloroflexi bacterium]|nr:hypothetical protein [Chloroflexota bacterium]
MFISWIRYGAINGTAVQASISFLGIGLVSGVGLHLILQRTDNQAVRISAMVGYLVMCPFALVGALFAGLGFAIPIVGTAVYGGLPLLAGTAVGYFLAYRVTKEG